LGGFSRESEDRKTGRPKDRKTERPKDRKTESIRFASYLIKLEMKKLLPFFVMMIVGFAAMSQKSQQQIMEDSVYGWYKVYNFKAKEYKPQVAFGRNYTPKQKAYVDSIANWIQASYIPKGGIGDVKRRLLSPNSAYLSLESLPQAYGVTAFTWSMFVKPDGKHDIIRETEIPFGVYANETVGMPIHFLCTPKQYYFTRPGSAEERFAFTDPSLRKKYDITQLPQLKKFITFYSEASNYDRNAGLVDAVLLSKDNKMPYVQITKREYLGLLPDAIERKFQEEKKYAEKNWPEGKVRDNALIESVARKEKRLLRLKENLDRYKNRLDEPAEVFSIQPSILLENANDIFTGDGGHSSKYGVYKVDPEMIAKCKEDNPQWVLITWNWIANDPKLVHMHESIINNFNFQYVYDFFFDKEKVKGKPYKPLNDPTPIKSENKTTLSETAINSAKDSRVHFFEDFSSSIIGQKPFGWYSEMSGAGTHALVTSLGEVEGKWLAVKGNKVNPLKLKKPLPSNFTLQFTVAVPKGFTWGGKSLEMVLASQVKEGIDDQSLSFKLRPGFDGRAGSGELSTSFKQNAYNPAKYGDVSGFSNNLPLNRIEVQIRKKGKDITVFIGGRQVNSFSTTMTSDISFNSLCFKHSRSDAPSEVYYISNIKLTTE